MLLNLTTFLLANSSFMPHGMCYLWQPGLVGLHLLSNAVIALSYFSIPFTLIYILRKRPDIPFNGIFILFAAFIVSCGVGHAFDIWTLWHPNYWLSGLIRAITASVSLLTAIALIQTIPQIVALPSPEQMQLEIKERQQVEAELVKERHFLQALLNNLSDGIVACNQEGVLTLFNRSTQEFHGLPKQSLPSQEWAEYYDLYLPDGQTLMSSQEIPLFRALQGEAVRNVEMMIVPKQGEPRILLANGDPIIAPDGEKLGAVVAMRDITANKKMQEKLQKNEERWQLAVASTGDGIWDWNVQTNEVYYSPRWKQMRGLQQNEIEGNLDEWVQLVHPDDYPLVMKAIDAHFTNQVAFNTEYRTLHTDGSYRWFLTKGQAVWDETGKVVRMVGAETDITQTKQAQASLARLNEELEARVKQRTSQLEQLNTILLTTTRQLEKRNQELDQFAYVASHDLKAPLRAIANLSAWLEEDLEDKLDDETRHKLNLLRGRVHRLENLINGLLAYARVGKSYSETQLVSVNRLLKQTIDSLVVPPEFKIEIIGKMPTLRTQLLPLQQTFTNLIDNAVKHHPRQDGKVSISVTEEENFYEFIITDDGEGIDPKYHDKIFTIFQTLEARDNKESTGIGLSIVKKAVEHQGGTISIKSELGQGTSICFTWKKK